MCPRCGSHVTQLYGRTELRKQRFRCLACQRTFIWKVSNNSAVRRRHWFKLWITESCSIRLLCRMSGYSASKLNKTRKYWLGQMPKEKIDYTNIQYVIYDGTYFHKDGCLLNLMDAVDQKIISHTYVQKESFMEAYLWFMNLKNEGLNPQFITTDGERSITRAMKLIWPSAKLQRCLYHIQHEGMRWLRTCPKTAAGKELRAILSKLSRVKTPQDRDAFIQAYIDWARRYSELVLSESRLTIALKDLRRTMVLINNALPGMFYYLEEKHVHPTTNALEGFHSRLKTDYQRHRGLSKKHRLQYINWYCFFENVAKTNTN